MEYGSQHCVRLGQESIDAHEGKVARAALVILRAHDDETVMWSEMTPLQLAKRLLLLGHRLGGKLPASTSPQEDVDRSIVISALEEA